MDEPIWNKFLTERDKAVFATSGYAARQGFGKRPALLIIDVNYAFCDERPMPILESFKRWRNSCGEDAWIAMPYLKQLIDKAHAKGIPVIYTTGVRRADHWDNADVVKTSEVLEFFDSLPSGMFDLPSGAPVEPHPSKRV